MARARREGFLPRFGQTALDVSCLLNLELRRNLRGKNPSHRTRAMPRAVVDSSNDPHAPRMIAGG